MESDNEKIVTLNYLKDMFNGTFDEDLIEAVLEQRNWNTDRALDDLMLMAQGNTFEIPIDDTTDTATNPQKTETEIEDTECTSENGVSDEKPESEDDIIVVDEEEFCLTGESESDDGKSASQKELVIEAPVSKPSYANVARKTPPAYQQISQIKPPDILYSGYTSFDRVKRTRDSIERVKFFVREKSKIMVILRGCPGSGKTYLANKILSSCNLDKHPYWYIHSSDNYFHINNQGTYQFDDSLLHEAHKWNQKNVLCVVHEGLTPVIIDNTNIKLWHMETYVRMAVCAGYEIEVIEPDTPWAFQASQLARKNTHNINKEKLLILLQIYEHNISSSLLLKSCQVEYATGNAPPQPGTCELTNSELLLLFEDLHNVIHVFPKQLKKLRKQKPTRKAKKKQRRLEDQKLDEIVQAIENCCENDSTVDEDTELDKEIAECFASRNLAETTDSEKSWQDVSDVSYLTVDEESLEDSGDESDDGENDTDDETETSISSDSHQISENEFDESEVAHVDSSEEENSDDKELKAENEQDMTCLNSMIDSFKNPVHLNENDATVEINASNKNKFSNRLYDALSQSVPRLKCFENFHDTDDPSPTDDLVDEEIANVSDPAIIQSVSKIIDEDSQPDVPPVVETDPNFVTPEPVASNTIVKNILNNALPSTEDKNGFTDSAELFSTLSAPVAVSSDLVNIMEDTGCRELDDPSTFGVDLLVIDRASSTRTSADSFHDAEESCSSFATPLNRSFISPEVTVIYNEPDKLEAKSNKSLKNINAANSAEDDRNSLLDEAKWLTSSVDSDTSLSYRNNLNDGDDLVTEPRDQVISSSKFKDIDDLSTNMIRNVIENDLWGDSFEDNTLAGADRNRCTSENSENSDYGSNSSSSDELRITDIHNSVNRFVNNDIARDPTGEKKKRNINLKNENSSAKDDVKWTVDSTVELNTLKERILVNSLDKVLNQRVPEDQDTDIAERPVLSRKSSISGFQMIENKLNDKNVERTDTEDAIPRDEPDVDAENTKLLSQWMKGDSWDAKETTEGKDGKSTEAKPPRNVHADSPSKQKNTETSNIRLVNDIKTCTDKNKNLSAKLKAMNFDAPGNAYFAYRSYPNSEDSMFGLSPAFDGKLKNINFSDTKDTFYGVNSVMPKKVNEGSSDDGERAKPSCSWSLIDDSDDLFAESRRKKNTDDITPKPNRKNAKKKEEKTPEYVEELVRKWKSTVLEETPPDYDKVLKWSPVRDCVDVEWNTDDNRWPKASNTLKPQRPIVSPNSNYFLPDDLWSRKYDKATNTGTDDINDAVQYLAANCREINDNRETPEVTAIELKMKCDKSTMTEGSYYTVKAKPIKADLANMFPKEMADSILDLYDKCNGNMDWMIEILMDDGYSPTDDQLEYLSSLQNVVKCDAPVEVENAKEKDKPTSEKKKKPNGNSKNNRRSNSHFEDIKDPIDSTKKIKRKKLDLREDAKTTNNEYDFSTESPDEDTESSVELFLDTNMVQQLIGYFGNPTVYSLKDCQPIIKLPAQLARQIHAYLLESVIDQAEKNEYLINQLAEEELITDDGQNEENTGEVTRNDMIEVENTLSDVINSNIVTSANSENSFASKLSLDLLLKSFPTVDPVFVNSTFKSNNCNYYETKNILNEMGTEVATNLTFNLNDKSRLVDQIKTNDAPLFENTTALARGEILEQVNSYRDDAAFNYEQWQKFNEQLKTAVQRKRFGVAPYYRELMSAFKQKYDEANANAAAVLINSCCFKNSNVIDLHFFKVTEALRALDIFLDHHIVRLANAARTKTTLYIITGRGTGNSDGVSHLQPPIKARLKKRSIEFEVQPYNTGLIVAVVRRSSPLTDDL